MAFRIGSSASASRLSTKSLPTTLKNNIGMACRLRMTSYTNQDGFVYLGNSGANGLGIIGNASGIGILFGGVAIGTAISLPLNTWIFAYLYRQSSLTFIYAFYDGKIVSGGGDATTPGDPTSYFGAATSTTGSKFEVCDIALWDSVITVAEIAEVAYDNLPVMNTSARPLVYIPGLNSQVSGVDETRQWPYGVISGDVVANPASNPPLRYTDPSRFWLPPTTFDPGAIAPVNTVAPVASGTPEIGQTLSCTTGTWTGTPTPTYTYQWQYFHSGVWSNITGATSSTWVASLTGGASIGDLIRCVVTATNSAGNASANSNSLGPLTAISFSGHGSAASIG